VKLKICQKLKEVEKTIGQKLAEKDREIAEYKDKAETRKRNLVSILSNYEEHVLFVSNQIYY